MSSATRWRSQRKVDKAALATIAGSLAVVLALVVVGELAPLAAPGEVSAQLPFDTELPGAYGSLAWDPADQVFWTVTDQGDQTSAWNVRLVRVALNGTHAGVVGVEPVTQSGRVVTGADMDLQDLALAPDRTLWAIDERQPAFVRMLRNGSIVQTIDIPLWRPHVPNRGPEGIAVSRDGTMLYALLESGLPNELDKTHTHLATYDLVSGTFTDYAYWLGDPAGSAYGRADPTLDYQGMGLALVGPGELLVLERGVNHTSGKEPFLRVFRVQVVGSPGPDPLPKTLFLDLRARGYRPDKPAGIALVDLRTLAVINDNDTNVRTPTWIWTFRV